MDDVTTLIETKVGTREQLDSFYKLHMGKDEDQDKEEPKNFLCPLNHL